MFCFVSRMELIRFKNETIKLKGRKDRNSLDKEIYNLRKTELVRPCKLLSTITADTECILSCILSQN